MLRRLLETLPVVVLTAGVFTFNSAMRKERRDMPPYVDFWTDLLRYDWKPNSLLIPRRGVLTPLGWKFWWLRLLCIVLAFVYVIVLDVP
jgi:hypothetical protein